MLFYYTLICKPLDKPEILLAIMNQEDLSNLDSKEYTFKQKIGILARVDTVTIFFFLKIIKY